MTLWSLPPSPPKPTAHRRPHVCTRPLCVALALALSTSPASASVLDNFFKLIRPSHSQSANQPHAQTADQPPPSDQAQPQADTLPLSEIALPASATPDLLTILQAEFAADRDNLAAALELYKQEAFKQNATAVFERALGLSLQLESTEQSLQFAKAWQDKNSDHVPVWFYVTHLALKAGDYQTAAHNLKLILSHDPKADLSRIFAGIFPAEPAAQRELFFALQTVGGDDNSSLAILKAGLLGQLNEHKAAILYLDKAIKVEPQNLAFLMLKADMLQGTGQHAALQKFLEQAQKRTTGDTQKQLYLYQIRDLIDHAKLAKAWKILQKTHKQFADDHDIALLASLVALDLKHFDHAIDLLSLLQFEPYYKDQAHYYLGIAHERQNEMDFAIAHYQQVQHGDFVLNATKKIIAHHYQAGDIDAAIATLVQLRQQHELFASDSYQMQADILLQLGRHDEAYQLLMQAVGEYPDDGQLLYAATMLLDDQKDYDKKKDNIAELLSLEATNPRYLLEYARLILLKNPHSKSAIKTATNISQIPADDGNYDSRLQLDALIVLAKNDVALGNFKAAIDKLQAPYDTLPSVPVGVVLLRAYQGLKQHAKVQALLSELKQLSQNAKPFAEPSPSPHTTTKTPAGNPSPHQ